MSRRGFIRAAGIAALSFLLPEKVFGKGSTKQVHYLKNNKLPVLLPGYRGNPFREGRFLNEMPKPDVNFGKLLKWRFSRNPQKEEKKRDTFSLTVKKGNSFIDDKRDMLVWLGHASWFIRLDGVTFLTDPCFDSPVFVKRLSELPCPVEDIKNVDYLLVSHSHRDHLDESSVEKLNLSGTEALLPLRMGRLLRKWQKGMKVQEAGWYQSFNTGKNRPEVILMPAQHWSQRYTGDQNQVLWGSYILKGSKKTIYFAGDTAYAPHFKKTAKLIPDIDIALMPIGAYKPAYIMKGSHTTPEEAVRAFGDLKADTFIPMHYGTFDLADEPLGEPIGQIYQLKEKGKLKGRLQVPDVGEVIIL